MDGQAPRHQSHPTPDTHHRLDGRAVAPHQLSLVGRGDLSRLGRSPARRQHGQGRHVGRGLCRRPGGGERSDVHSEDPGHQDEP
jgi:hypothetical protein